MNSDRQQSFLALKGPCVNLSAVALKFRTNEVPVKDVLRALESVHDVLDRLAKAKRLDPKLAEYAFFPLAQQVFNEAQKLSPRCLEVAVNCVTLLVIHGYGPAILPELGKQLLILMSMIAGGGPTQRIKVATDEMKVASFDCISAITSALASSASGTAIFEDQGTKNIVDQLVYLLLDAITESKSDHVQISASEVLSQLIKVIQNRVFLASLLPRTVSSLTKALRPDNTSRKTQKVLTTNIQTLRQILIQTLADQVALRPQDVQEKEALDSSWLKATAAQVKTALLQVAKLRSHNAEKVRRSIEELCVAIIEQCQIVLADSVAVMLETLVVLSAMPDNDSAKGTCQYLTITYPNLLDQLRHSFMDWSQTLPRHMQSSDEQVRLLALRKLTAAVPLLSNTNTTADMTLSNLLPLLTNSIASMIQDSPNKAMEITEDIRLSGTLIRLQDHESTKFQSFMLSHESQKSTVHQLKQLFQELSRTSDVNGLLHSLIGAVTETNGRDQLAALWLTLRLLEGDNMSSYLADDMLLSMTSFNSPSRHDLLADLNAITFQFLSSSQPETNQDPIHWHIQALAMETLVRYAQTFPNDTYRSDLVDTLYPVLSFLASPNPHLRSHAITALVMLAKACQYSSTQDLLIQNVDYLVNSIAWKLNIYNLSPEAPRILKMMISLCGADLVPYLDDLIQSIFAALDNYHGYPEWVELLFSTLKSIVEVSIKEPHKTITVTERKYEHRKPRIDISRTKDIISDLQARKQRKQDFSRAANEPPTAAPHRPWTSKLDGPSFTEVKTEDDSEEAADDSEDHLKPLQSSSNEDETKSKLSKSHNLLLQIATSTVPHLASPSPTVRHRLLDLLRDLSPLLSRDENTFLPLVNAMWPVIVPRLFATTSTSDGDGVTSEEEETSYNIIAAAETIGMLCTMAGDFMSSRIEDIMQQLVRMFKRVEKYVNEQGGAGQHASGIGKALSGTVALRVVDELEGRALTRNTARDITSSSSAANARRTPQGQVLNALLDLFVTILDRVSLNLDTGDEVAKLLLPFSATSDQERGTRVRSSVSRYNEDMVWLWDQQRLALAAVSASENKVVDAEDRARPADGQGHDMPFLGSRLEELGASLRAIDVL